MVKDWRTNEMDSVNSNGNKDVLSDETKNFESDEAYRRLVYGELDDDLNERTTRKSSAIRRISRQFSRELIRRRSSVVENLPETPAGWAVLSSVLASALLGYEIQVQKSLTCPPLVYGQCREGPMKPIYDKMTESPASILRRPIQPSLFVGTNSLLSSTAAYMTGGPSSSKQYIRFREIMKMTFDGATVALEWELPILEAASKTTRERQDEILHGPIDRPVVLVIHGINNHADFGYIRSMMRACTDRGWIAAGMNMRGCGGIALTSPRGYNGAYTGDIRCVVQRISGRLKKADSKVPVFLVGNSLSASLVTKYLGEEGLSETLPECVAGGAALGTPLSMKSSNMDILFSPILALGAKKTILQHWASIRQMTSPFHQSCIRKALLAVTLADFDIALAPIFQRNDPIYPFAWRIGFKNGPAYWNNASSYRLIRFIPVPMLQLVASDDFLVYNPFKNKIAYCLANPNVMIVETKCGGHLGWHESPPEGNGYGIGKSWADVATTDFIEAVFQTYCSRDQHHKVDQDPYFNREEAGRKFETLRSRL